MKKGYRTLRGFLDGQEREEANYFAYSASLRIFGDIKNLEEIGQNLKLQPSHAHRKGDRRTPRSAPYKHDMWSYSPSLSEEEPLHKHIDALWAQLKPHTKYLLQLKKTQTVDVFLGYRSNCDTAGVEIPHTSLEIFMALEVPLGLSIIVT